MSAIFITGANRGIGLSLTQQYLEGNHKVYTTYRDANSAQELLSLADHNTNLTCIQLELTNYQAVSKLPSKIQPIDILIGNAGYYGPKGYGLGNTDVEEWRRVFEINTIAPLKLVETLLPMFKNSDVKKIACLSSKVGSMAENTSGGGYLYRSSKAALNSVVKSLSNDLTLDGFTVLALHPGWVKTEMGGPNALIDTGTSASGLINVIESSNTKVSGHFFNFDGSEIDW
ncbi:SDR family oxidoreductase [Vibrio genomosp. F10 str. 9ZC157]|uniref:Short-chain dehydrogenase n=1 Tax=Vibrio genomosp. F10 str. ZF-129 TaxID=1187848 RepID=A0A1E5BG25_9VIBR|nr:SDR family oxidoreductase [Vibrio genomosp. F10]OEE34822.1 short-chain dehydrogenase [Vibrio genomosp. F10 str. ZF-129]OEE95964.1 short-chain dehydrogenase [Vibrio genomosp. F10 str. 9ZC157]